MKKVLFSLIAMSFLATTIISCQSNQKGTAESDADSTTVAANADTAKTQQVATTPAGANSGKALLDVSPNIKVKTPQFSSEEVNEGFEKFEPIKQEYIAAINSKDAAKIKAANAKYWEWVKVASAWGNKLPREENQIYVDHYTKLVAQWDKLSLKLKK